jgi:hypothetical protein
MLPPTTSTAVATDPVTAPAIIDALTPVAIEEPVTMDWEEPHPGLRLSFPLEASSGWDERTAVSDISQTDEGGRGDMAVKGHGPYHSGGKLVRRSIKVRTRNFTPKPITIPTHVSEEPESKSAPLPQLRSVLSSPTSTIKVKSPAATISTHVMEVDADLETGPPTRCEDADCSDQPTPMSPKLPCGLKDLSNLLGITIEPEIEQDLITVIDPEAASLTTPDDDMYGWEAELDRKAQVGVPSPGPVDLYNCDEHLQYRRANGNKRSLLHRVFSLGGSPRDVPLNERRASAST